MTDTLYSSLSDQRTQETLNGDFLMLSAERNSLPNHVALYYAGDLKGSGSTSKKVPHIGLMGYDLPAAAADGASVVPSAIADASSVVTVGRYTKAYQPSDTARFTDSLGALNATVFAQDAVMGRNLRLTQLIASLMGGFSNKVGSSGVDLSIANVLAALTLLEVGYQSGISPGDAMGILHTQQGGDLRTALATATGGALQWNVPAEQLVLKGSGFRGRYLDVDWFVNGHVPTANAGADRSGGIFVRGAVIYADMGVDAEGDQVAIGGKVLFERDRTALAGLTAYVNHSYMGVVEGIDAHGVCLETDA